MIGSAMRKPRIQPGRGSARADSMIDGRTMVIGTVSPNWDDQGPFAQGLGVRVGVRPAERLGPGLADLDHLLLDPVLAQALGPLGQQVEAGTAELLAGRLVEPGQPLGLSGLGLGVAALAPGGAHLVAPVDVHGERVGVEQLLFGLALVGAGHVGGRHRDVVHRAGPAVGLGQLRGRPRWRPPPGTGRAG